MTDRVMPFVATAAAVIVGGLVAWAGSDGSVQVGEVPVFAVCAGFAFAINWMAFVPALAAGTERWFDLTGSATYVTVIAVALALRAEVDARSFVVAAMVIVWAVRLGSFLIARIRRAGHDPRFDRIKSDAGRFLMTWTLQGLWVLLTASAALAVITSTEPQPLGPAATVGAVVWGVGFAIEVVADAQKSAFRRNPDNHDRFITTGLWAWSRHPNYFGEIVLWVGVAVTAVPVLSGWRAVVLISPVFVALLLTRISGIPLLEARAERRWGDHPEFRAYFEATPRLLPRPPRR